MTPEPDTDLDVQPTPDAAPGDEVEQLLSQYDQEQAGKPAEPTPEAPTDTQAPETPEQSLDDFVPKTTDDLRLRSELLAMREQVLQHAERHDLDLVLKQARAEIPELDQIGLPDSFVEGWLARQYRSDPKLQRDWDGRARNPDAAMNRIGKALGALQRELKSMPDRKLSADRESVTAALRGMSDGTAAREINWDAVKWMSNIEFDRFARSLERK